MDGISNRVLDRRIYIAGTAADDFNVEVVEVGTTEVQISTVTEAYEVLIKADDDNTDDIYIGKSGVTVGNGFRLKAGQGITLKVRDPSKIYAISATDGQKIYVLYEV